MLTRALRTYLVGTKDKKHINKTFDKLHKQGRMS